MNDKDWTRIAIWLVARTFLYAALAGSVLGVGLFLVLKWFVQLDGSNW